MDSSFLLLYIYIFIYYSVSAKVIDSNVFVYCILSNELWEIRERISEIRIFFINTTNEERVLKSKEFYIKKILLIR